MIVLFNLIHESNPIQSPCVHIIIALLLLPVTLDGEITSTPHPLPMFFVFSNSQMNLVSIDQLCEHRFI